MSRCPLNWITLLYAPVLNVHERLRRLEYKSYQFVLVIQNILRSSTSVCSATPVQQPFPSQRQRADQSTGENSYLGSKIVAGREYIASQNSANGIKSRGLAHRKYGKFLEYPNVTVQNQRSGRSPQNVYGVSELTSQRKQVRYDIKVLYY
jgi:hypothetical protein